MNVKNKRLVISCITALVLLLILNFLNIRIYEEYVYNSFNELALTFIEKYPEDEEEIASILLKENHNDYLKKYGFTIDNLNLVESITKTKIKIVFVTTLSYLILLILLSLIFKIYRRKLKKEIKTINNYLELILQNSYDLNISDYNEDEISILKNDIYKVAIKLKEYSMYEKKEKEYLMNTLEDISHQLKTPLTALNILNDILKDHELTVEERKDFLNKQEREIKKIEWLIITLLNMSKIDSGSVKLKEEQIKIEDLINLSLESLLVPLELKGIEVTYENLGLDIVCDIFWTKEALTNILKNAMEHVDKNGKIKIRGEDNPLYKAVIITDNGIGISKSEIKNIFKRFFSSSSNKNSVGIGLNMAKIIIEKENGKIEVESKKGEYTTFKIIFYKKNV